MDKSALSALACKRGIVVSVMKLKNARNSSLRYLISEAKNIVRDRYSDAGLSWIRCARVLVYRIPIFHLFLRRSR